MTVRFDRFSLIQKLLMLFLVLLVTMHVATLLLAETYPGSRAISELQHYFDLDQERNVPTLYSSLILGMCAFVCVALSTRCKKWLNRLVYYGFGAFFLYVAFDESLVLHEGSAAPIRKFLGITDGNPLYHAWVLPAIGVLLAGFMVYKFLRDKGKESKFQRRVLLYILAMGAGVVLLEIIGTKVYVSLLAYKLGPVLIEEAFEIGMVSFILGKLSTRLLKHEVK